MSTLPFQVNGNSQKKRLHLRRFFPILEWLPAYRSEYLPGDLFAGAIVTIMLVPQSMAYALLAGLPPQVGLYASIVPLLIYGMMGTSKVLAVGPVAIVSLLVATGINQMQPTSEAEALSLAIVLALMVGLIQLIMGLLQAGFLVNFLSHPVLSGFINGAAVVIALSQIKHVLGVSIPHTDHTHETIIEIIRHIPETNMITLGIAGVSVGGMFYFKTALKDHLKSLRLPEHISLPLTKSGALIVVILSTLAVKLFDLHTTVDVAIVGEVPVGLPPFTMPLLDPGQWGALLPTAITISLVGFMESISVAKSLASKRRQKVDANQELIALGSANLGAAFTGAYPITGGISRSVVNYSAGANTGLASITTASLVALTVLFLTPLFHDLPQAVLAAIILVAVSSLFDASVLKHAWRYNRMDALCVVATFLAVLFLGVETGILLGIGLGLVLYLWRTSRPHIAVVGRVDDTEHYRNVLRHDVQTYPNILAIRVDESLYFPNVQYLQNVLLSAIADYPDVDHLVLICSAVNYVDTSALEVLDSLIKELNDAGVQFYLAEVKGPVMDGLRRSGFVERLGPERIFLSTHQAMINLAVHAHPPTADPSPQETLRR